MYQLQNIEVPESNNRPQGQELNDQLETDRTNYEAYFQDQHLHSAIDSIAYCSLGGRH